MNAGFLKRLGAYLIDFIIVLLVANLITRFLPNNSEIIELNNKNMNLLSDYYEIIGQGDMDKINEYSALLNDYSYELNKLSIWTNLLTIVLYFLYFVVFQSYNNGQTVGKKLLKIEIVGEDGNSPSLKQMLIRGIILYPIVLSLLDVILINILNKSMYLSASNVIAYLQYAIYLICFITVIISGRGIHDKLAGTSVIKFGTVADVEESKVSKWKQTALKEKEAKKYRVNHTSGKRKE